MLQCLASGKTWDIAEERVQQRQPLVNLHQQYTLCAHARRGSSERASELASMSVRAVGWAGGCASVGGARAGKEDAEEARAGGEKGREVEGE